MKPEREFRIFGMKIKEISEGKVLRRAWFVWKQADKKYVVVCKTPEKQLQWKKWFLDTLKDDPFLNKEARKLEPAYLGNGISLLRLFHVFEGRTYFQVEVHPEINNDLIPDVTDEQLKNGAMISLEEIKKCMTPNSH